MPKLNDTQRVLLSAAARRDGGALLPLPKRLKLDPRTLTRNLKELLKKGLVTEAPAPADAPAWREAEDRRFILRISPAGLEAIGVVPAGTEPESGASVGTRPETPKRSKRKTGSKSNTVPASVRPGTKLALLIAMLGCDDGATIPEIVAATGWQRHSVRGAISGTLKKKLGLAVASETEEGRGRIYRIAQAD